MGAARKCPHYVGTKASECAQCQTERRIARKRARKEFDEMMRDLGMKKVRGSVSGMTYWE